MALQIATVLQRGFRVTIEPHLFQSDGTVLLSELQGRRVLVITTPTVGKLYAKQLCAFFARARLDAVVETLQIEESCKSLETVSQICTLSIDHRLGRHDVLLALGGGVCSDLVGVSASLVRRGIRHVRVPTTLVGQIDAGIGIKSGVNFRNRKNYLGAFHAPTAVCVDTSLLATLSADQIRQGLAEIIKIALICDAGLFELIEEFGSRLLDSRFQSPQLVAHEVIARSIGLMLDQLAENPFESSTRRLVDMGHTFSPTLEEESGFSLPHGEAVAIDMALSCLLAEELGYLRPRDSRRTIEIIRATGLPIWSGLLTPGLCMTAMANAVAHRGGQLNLVLPTCIGGGVFLEHAGRLDEKLLARAIGKLTAIQEEGVPDVPMADLPAEPAGTRVADRPQLT